MYCSRCGYYIGGNSVRCARCGQYIGAPKKTGFPSWAIAVAIAMAAYMALTLVLGVFAIGVMFHVSGTARAALRRVQVLERAERLPQLPPQQKYLPDDEEGDPDCEDDPYTEDWEDDFGEDWWEDFWGDDDYGWYPDAGTDAIVPYAPDGDDRYAWPPQPEERASSSNPYDDGWADDIDMLLEPGDYTVGRDIPEGDYVIDTRDRSPTPYERAWLFYQEYQGDDYEEEFVTWRFINLRQGDIISFGNAWMYPLEDFICDAADSEVLPEGTYRIGEDIPAGDYEATNLPGDAGDYLLQDDMRLHYMMLLEAEVGGMLTNQEPETFYAEEGKVLYLCNATMRAVYD